MIGLYDGFQCYVFFSELAVAAMLDVAHSIYIYCYEKSYSICKNNDQ